MTDFLVVSSVQVLESIRREVAILETAKSEVVVLEKGIQGPPGPPGAGNVLQVRFELAAPQAEFTLPGTPINGVCLFSLNGILQHEYVCAANVVSIDPPAEVSDSIMITWWQYA